MEKKLGNCQRFQEIKPTPTPSQIGRETQSLSGFKGKNIQLILGKYRQLSNILSCHFLFE